MKKVFDSRGMPPEELADIVFNAIRQEQFWIIPDTDMDGSIRDRMEEHPQPHQPGADPESVPVATRPALAQKRSPAHMAGLLFCLPALKRVKLCSVAPWCCLPTSCGIARPSLL